MSAYICCGDHGKQKWYQLTMLIDGRQIITVRIKCGSIKDAPIRTCNKGCKVVLSLQDHHTNHRNKLRLTLGNNKREHHNQEVKIRASPPSRWSWSPWLRAHLLSSPGREMHKGITVATSKAPPFQAILLPT